MGRMHRLVALPLAIAIAGFGPADAMASGIAGIALEWGTCGATHGDFPTQRFACDRNDDGAVFRLVASFRSPIDLPDFVGTSLTLDLRSGSGSIPDWWSFANGACRNGSFSFPSYTTSLGTNCIDVWKGAVAGGGFTITTPPAPTLARLRIVMDVWRTEPLAVAAGSKCIAGVAAIDLQHTIDDGTGGVVCGGCLEPMCISLVQVEVLGARPGEAYLLEQPDPFAIVRWQSDILGGYACPSFVATRVSTWGAIKALYR